MSDCLKSVVIVGAGAAGLSAAQALRDEGFSGAITMVGDEPELPYDRPPLSKQILLGTTGPDELTLRPAEFFQDNDIQILGGVAATGLDLGQRRLALDTGRDLDYDALVIATGLRARSLSGQPMLDGMHTLRTIQDARVLQEKLASATTVAVIGAGFLGSEIAASARQRGCQVVLIDPAETPMRRQLGREIGHAVTQLHRSRGVEVLCDTGVQGVLADGSGRVCGITLTDGSRRDADLVVVAIGSVPATDWLRSSGLALDNGVMCDAFCRAAPGVFAAGDVASWFSQRMQTHVRLEHRMNATEHGMAVARNILGASQPYDPIPYFWTDVYDVKIQGFGLAPADAAMTVLTGSLAEPGFSGALVSSGRIDAVVGWNAPRQVRRGRSMIGRDVEQFQLSVT